MAAKMLTIKGIRVRGKTKQEAVAIYNETVHKDIDAFTEKHRRDDVQIVIGRIDIAPCD